MAGGQHPLAPGEAAPLARVVGNRGRRLGTKNKPKPKDTYLALAEKIRGYVTKEDLQYLSQTLEHGEPSILQRDLDIVLGMSLKSLLPIIAGEIKDGALSREGTQRTATIKELLALRFQMEKHDKGAEQPNSVTFIQNIFAERGIGDARLAQFLGAGLDNRLPAKDLPRIVSGTPDGDEQAADGARAVPDSVPQRSVEIPARREVTSDRLLVDYQRGSGPQNPGDAE